MRYRREEAGKNGDQDVEIGNKYIYNLTNMKEKK